MEIVKGWKLPRIGVALFIGVGLAVTLFSRGLHPASDGNTATTAATDLCRVHSAALSGAYANAAKTGLLTATGSNSFGFDFDVDENAWVSMTHDGKIALALSAYCHVASNGRATVVLYGLHDVKTKASIVDGNYSD